MPPIENKKLKLRLKTYAMEKQSREVHQVNDGMKLQKKYSDSLYVLDWSQIKRPTFEREQRESSSSNDDDSDDGDRIMYSSEESSLGVLHPVTQSDSQHNLNFQKSKSKLKISPKRPNITSIKNYLSLRQQISDNISKLSEFKINHSDQNAHQKVYDFVDKYNQPIEEVTITHIEKLGSGGQGKAFKVQLEVNANVDAEVETTSNGGRLIKQFFVDKECIYHEIDPEVAMQKMNENFCEYMIAKELKHPYVVEYKYFIHGYS